MAARSASARSRVINRDPLYNRDRHRLADARWRANLSKCYTILSRVIGHQRTRISKIQILKKTKHHLEMLECTLQDLLHLKAKRIGYHERSTLPRGLAFEDFLNDFLSMETFTLGQYFSWNVTPGIVELYKSVLRRERQLHSLPTIELPPRKPPEQSSRSLREIIFEATADSQVGSQMVRDPEETRLEEDFSFGVVEERVVPQGPPGTPSTSQEPCQSCGNPRGKGSRRKGHPRILGRTVRRRLLDERENHTRNYVPNLETLVEQNDDQSLPDSGYILCSPFTKLIPAQDHRIEEPESLYYVEEYSFSCEDMTYTTEQSWEQNWFQDPNTSGPSPRLKPTGGRPLHIVWLNREDAATGSPQEEDQTVPVVTEPRTPYATLQGVNTEPGFPSPPLMADLDLGEDFNLSAYMNWCENLEHKEKHTEYETLWDGLHQ